MNQQVLVTDPLLIEAIRNGDVEGEIYQDGDVYADFESASRWLREQPLSLLEESILAGKSP